MTQRITLSDLYLVNGGRTLVQAGKIIALTFLQHAIRVSYTVIGGRL